MKTKILLLFIAVGWGATFATAANTRFGITLRIGAPPPIVVREAPPRPVVVESRAPTPAPASNYVWVPSHQSWRDGHWVQVEGGWVVPPQPGAVLVEGRWDPQTRSWTEEHWEINSPTPNGPPPPVAQPGPPPQPGYPGNYYEGSPGEIVVESAPPPPREERMSVRPSRQHVWIAGYWTANHGRHEWVAGRWEIPPRERSTWVAPRWEQRGRSHVFISGYWR